MNKKVFLSCLSLVMLVITSAYVPAAVAAKMSTPMIAPASPPVPGGNGPHGNGPNRNGPSTNAASPQVSSQQGLRRIVGIVTDYSAGQSITIADRLGNEFTFDLDSPLKIVPSHRANQLGQGAYVTIIAPNNVPNGKHIAVGVVIHRGAPNSFVPPTVTPPPPTVTPPTVTPPTVTPPSPTPDGPVPPDDQPDIDRFATDRPLSTVIGFTFPASIDVGGVVPLEAAAFLDVQPPFSDGFTEVGMVSISLESIPTQFIVAIDLVSTTDIVSGQLISIAGPDVVDVNFRRIPQMVNPDRANATYEEFQLDSPPGNKATIASDSVCFILNTAADTFTRYCSTNETVVSSFAAQQIASLSSLSVKDSFPTQYTDLQNIIVAAAAHIGFQGPLALDQTLSTIQDAQRLQDCADASDSEESAQQTACASDIVAAPVPLDYFDQQYNEKFRGDNGDDDDDEEDDEESGTDDSSAHPTPIQIGVVSVLQPIEYPTADPGTVQPGDYRLDAWFDANGVFFAVTLTGLTTNDIQVVNQQIPAVPATFIDASGNGPDAEISSFCICRYICIGK